MDELRLDYESRSLLDLPTVGLDRYSADPSTEIFMASWQINGGTVQQWEARDGRMPAELKDALLDPSVTRRAFNAQFERVMTRRVLKIKTPYENWRCTQVMAYMLSFAGTLLQVGQQIGIDSQYLKSDGKKYINMFSKPHAITKTNPNQWWDWNTHPFEWDEFLAYNRQDVIAEGVICDYLLKYPQMEEEWKLYELDQRINDRGVPIDLEMCDKATRMAAARKDEFMKQMKQITGLSNPNSVTQLKPWIKERGYRFDDLGKDTIKKVLAEDADSIKLTGEHILSPDCVKVLGMRRQTARTSVGKYQKFKSLCGPGNRLRFPIQFAGASRTQRWAARGAQIHNLGRTPKALEPQADGDFEGFGIGDYNLRQATEAIQREDLDFLKLLLKEPMDGIAGCVRSVIRAEPGYELVTSDLASIESVVIGWLSGCERLLNVFREGRDAYRDFATELFKKPYSEVTSSERSLAKPATLGAGYRLGGGELDAYGKRTGLWGYAENMGIDMTQKQAIESVRIFRETYPEIPVLWKNLENAIIRTIKLKKVSWVGPVAFELRKGFLVAVLPSGRRMYYQKPRLETRVFQSKDRETGQPLFHEDGSPVTYKKTSFSYMGFNQDFKKWMRQDSHGGKMTENLVQAIAREILKYGLFNAAKAGFNILFHVHDEIVTQRKIGDERYSLKKLISCMIERQPWYGDMPLNAAGWVAPFYRKD